MGKAEEIKKIVAWQFDGVTNLNPEAYKDSLRIISNQICQLFEPKSEEAKKLGATEEE